MKDVSKLKGVNSREKEIEIQEGGTQHGFRNNPGTG